MFNGNSLSNDLLDNVRMGTTPHKTEEQASEVGVHTLITTDEFIGEGKTRHKPTLLEPEDGGEGTREENALDSGKGDKTFGET